MKDPFQGTLYLVVYMLAFTVGTLGIGIWAVRRQKLRPPLEFKLLRGPGESLRRKISQDDENMIFWFLGAALVPVLMALMVFAALIWLTPTIRMTYGVAIAVAPSLVTAVFAGRFALRKLFRTRNDLLGYLGERVVGEALQPLSSMGYRIFHDVPAEAGKLKFNVDHVAVGPNGVFAIETKTRRKGRARSGFEDHRVSYDGKRLIWPWVEDTWGLENAENRARWMSEWLNKMTGLSIVARPVLALPGWYVSATDKGPVTVVNHKMLAGAIPRDGRRVLSDGQIDLIARQLEGLCRDIED